MGITPPRKQLKIRPLRRWRKSAGDCKRGLKEINGHWSLIISHWGLKDRTWMKEDGGADSLR